MRRRDVVSEDGGKTWYLPVVEPTRPGEYRGGEPGPWFAFRFGWDIAHGFASEDGVSLERAKKYLMEYWLRPREHQAIESWRLVEILRNLGWRDHEPVKGLGVFWYPDPEFGVKRGEGRVSEESKDGCEEANS
jgi:hypothetical protein